MAESFESLKAKIVSLGVDRNAGSFAILAEIASLAAREGPSAQSMELVIRALDRSSVFQNERELLIGLARDHGLYPYITNREGQISSDDLPLRDAIAMEMHRPENLEVVFHRVQAQVYQRLLSGENVILSAPTSFGKSLIVDSLIASRMFRNIVIIVPTIALLDETRRRLTAFRQYKIVTHPGQSYAEFNLFVLTQERFLAMDDMPQPDFFFIDEFYKLDDANADEVLSGRSALLNQAIRQLMKTRAQFYMAGPSIAALDTLLPSTIQAAFIRTDYATVVADTIKLSASNDEERRSEILRVLGETDESTLIYCRSPRRVREVVRWLVDHDVRYGPGMAATATWVEANYSPKWSLAGALRRGVGAHHGRLPRWLAQEMVQGFNAGDLKVLVCTNSLIEGVNTRAKNIIILDKKIATKAYDFFTFANIRGRAGRMLKHFVGKIYLFHPEPENVLPEIDMPGLTQSEAAPSSLLLTIDPSERTERSKERLNAIVQQRWLSQETLLQNVGVEPERQIMLAEHLSGLSVRELNLLRWSSAFPSYDEIKVVVELIWHHMPPEYFRSHGALSSNQLTFFVSRASQANGDTAQIIDTFCEKPDWWATGETVDDRIELAFDFLRYWIDHNLPILLRAVSLIAGEVLEGKNISPGNFTAFAARVEAGFQPPLLVTLEEFGIPVNVSRKLIQLIPRYDSLDGLLGSLRLLDINQAKTLTKYEKFLVVRTLSST